MAFLEQIWLQIGNNMPLKTPGNPGAGDFDKKKTKNINIWRRNHPVLNREFIQVLLNFWHCEQKKEQQKSVTNSTQKVSDL